MDNSSGVGVLDKAATVLGALEAGPATLAQLVGATGLARPTAHRLAVALEHHRLVTRDMQGRFVLGPAARASSRPPPARTGCSPPPARFSARCATTRTRAPSCSAARATSASAWLPPSARSACATRSRSGSSLTMLAGSAAQILLAWEEPDRLHRGLQGAKFTATALSAVRRRGWAQSVGEREPGVASVSAPVRGPSGRVVAAVSISGPIERLSRQPGRLHAATVVAGANKLTEVLRRAQNTHHA